MLRARREPSNQIGSSPRHPGRAIIRRARSDTELVLERVPAGRGWALDLGGGAGALRAALEARGYRYANLDLAPSGSGAVVGDAHRTPFSDRAFSLILSVDSLEHFVDPRAALAEVRRLLAPGGAFVVWVPFLHPFHGDDFYRYTPLGLRTLFTEARLGVESLEAPRWAGSVVARAASEALRRIGLAGLVPRVERAAAWVDEGLIGRQGEGKAFAAVYLMVARRGA